MINKSVALGVPSIFLWSWNPKVGLSLFHFSISDADLKEPCGEDSSISNWSPPIAYMIKTEGDIELEDFKVSFENEIQSCFHLSVTIKAVQVLIRRCLIELEKT